MKIEIKQPMEKYPIELDFSDRLIPSEKITSVSVKAYLNKTECTEEIIASSEFKLQDVTVKLKNGYENNYKVEVVVQTDDNNSYEKDVLLMVRSY